VPPLADLKGLNNAVLYCFLKFSGGLNSPLIFDVKKNKNFAKSEVSEFFCGMFLI